MRFGILFSLFLSLSLPLLPKKFTVRLCVRYLLSLTTLDSCLLEQIKKGNDIPAWILYFVPCLTWHRAKTRTNEDHSHPRSLALTLVVRKKCLCGVCFFFFLRLDSHPDLANERISYRDSHGHGPFPCCRQIWHTDHAVGSNLTMCVCARICEWYEYISPLLHPPHRHSHTPNTNKQRLSIEMSLIMCIYTSTPFVNHSSFPASLFLSFFLSFFFAFLADTHVGCPYLAFV